MREQRGRGLTGSLLAEDAADEIAGNLQLFGQFVGEWDLEWRGLDATGLPTTAAGELVFGWILGGRAIQDTWRVPVHQDGEQAIRGFFGTTVRFYDPSIEAWRSTWIEPGNGNVRRFIGRPTADGILLEPLDGARGERWSFVDIHPGTFTWRSQVILAGEWLTEEEMYATRRR